MEVVAGADKGKAIIILNPANPPLMMTNTIYSLVRNPDEKRITQAVEEMVKITEEIDRINKNNVL